MNTQTNAAVITVDHLVKRFGRFAAVNDLSFAVEPGAAVALWGANGAGKTTVIKCMLGLLGYQGRIVVNGYDARRQGKAARRSLGYVPQELAFHGDMRTLETARFYARLKDVGHARVDEVLTQVGLAEHTAKPVAALSGGMKQRLALGLALLADPPLLILDEPTSNLDAVARDQFLQLLRTIKLAGKTILFTSHHLGEVEVLGDHVLLLERGQLVVEVPAHELATRAGLKSRIKLFVAEDDLDAAVGVLVHAGYTANRNGTGLYVEVEPGQKASPIRSLAEADIIVRDFEVI